MGVNRLIMRNFFTPILPADGGAVPARNAGRCDPAAGNGARMCPAGIMHAYAVASP